MSMQDRLEKQLKLAVCECHAQARFQSMARLRFRIHGQVKEAE